MTTWSKVNVLTSFSTLGRSCITAVEPWPRDLEVKDSIPAVRWAFSSSPSFLSVFSITIKHRPSLIGSLKEFILRNYVKMVYLAVLLLLGRNWLDQLRLGFFQTVFGTLFATDFRLTEAVPNSPRKNLTGIRCSNTLSKLSYRKVLFGYLLKYGSILLENRYH